MCIIPPWCNLTVQICGGEILWVKMKGIETKKRNNNDHLLHIRRSGKEWGKRIPGAVLHAVGRCAPEECLQLIYLLVSKPNKPASLKRSVKYAESKFWKQCLIVLIK